MSKPTLYYHLVSPPARSVYMLAHYLGLDFEEKEVNIFEFENASEDYRKINVTGTVPAFVDGNVRIFDSHAINLYLVEKFAKNDDLYPKNNLLLRTRINEILFYESSYLFARWYDIMVPIYLHGETEIPDYKKNAISRGYECVEKFLTGVTHIAGNQLTVADFSVWSVLELLIKYIPASPDKYPNINAYLERMRQDFPTFKNMTIKAVEHHYEKFLEFVERNKELQQSDGPEKISFCNSLTH